MATRDPRLAATRKVEVAEATVNRCATTLEEARQASRRAKADAVKAGVTKTELARLLGTSESRIRQEILRSMSES
jgi:hypothetical protein